MRLWRQANDVVSKKYLDAQIEMSQGPNGFMDLGISVRRQRCIKRKSLIQTGWRSVDHSTSPESVTPIQPYKLLQLQIVDAQVLLYEIAARKLAHIFMGVTSQMRLLIYPDDPFLQTVRIPDSGLFVNSPSAEYYDL